MAEYWVGPSLRQKRPARWVVAEAPRLAGQPPRLRRRARPLTPRRWRALLRLTDQKLHDVTFLARYAAHSAVLVLTVAVTLLHGHSLSDFLKPPVRAVEAPQPMIWGDADSEQLAYLSWGALPETAVAELPAAARESSITYQVREGDNPTIIAERFGLEPSTIVWSNSNGQENPVLLQIGQTLVIPPVDGVLHTVQEGESVAALADKYKVGVESITTFNSNQISDPSAPLIVGQQVMVPGGIRPYDPPKPVVVVTPAPAPAPPPVAVAPAPRPAASTSSSSTTTSSTTTRPAAAASTTSSSNYGGATGSLIWPVRGRITQNPSSYHMAIDVAAPLGTPVYAADGGRVVYAGWDNTGYGYMVLVDHGNGRRTLYAHFSYYYVSYGDYVNRGAMIGKVGSTGRSTGPHLHFEVRRYNSSTWWRDNPYNYLP